MFLGLLAGEGLSLALFLIVSQTNGITLQSLMTLLIKRPWLLQMFCNLSRTPSGILGFISLWIVNSSFSLGASRLQDARLASRFEKSFLGFLGFLDLRLLYIPSTDNIADLPSRRTLRQDAMLSSPLWDSVQSAFGGLDGHSIYFMAFPSNVRHGLGGSSLPFFAPFPASSWLFRCQSFCPGFFSISRWSFSNLYVFPL